MKIGFIGAGNMAYAMIKGILNSELVTTNDIIASAKTNKNLLNLKNNLNIKTTLNNNDVALESDILVIAVKPHLYELVLNEVKTSIKPNCLVVSIAAGISINFIEEFIGSSAKVIRTMPNTPALVGQAMTAISFNDNVTNDEQAIILNIFNCFGKSEIISETLMDSIPSISGSSPAYVYMMIEAMGDAGVMQGLPRDLSYKLAAQAVLGAAQMVLESGEHPGKLKDNVTSPGGTTIEAIAKLEECGFRHSIITAMNACTEKAKKMQR